MTLFETLAIKNSKPLNINYHNERFIKGQLLMNKPLIISDISTLINPPKALMPDSKKSLMRCRVTYNAWGVDVSYSHYTPKAIKRFKLVYSDDIKYDYKYDNRQALDELMAQKSHCDEIIIIKQGLVTDCSIGNLLFLKQGIWYTPTMPLLHGTQRAFLLDNQQIVTADMTTDKLMTYEKIMMINALNPFDERRAIPITPWTVC